MSKHSLVELFEERIKAIQARKAGILIKPTDDAHELAERTAAELMRHANAFIPNDLHRRNVLADDELIAQWPLEMADGGKLLTRLGLHPAVSANDAAEMLERLPNDPLALFLAAMVRVGAWPGFQYPSGRPDGWVLAMDRELARFRPTDLGIDAPTWDDAVLARDGLIPTARDAAGLVVPIEHAHMEASGRVLMAISAYWQCAGKWDAHSVSVLVYLERKVLQAYGSLVRIPADITTAITSARSGINEKVPPRMSGETFPVPEAGFRHWRITPPNGTQLEMILPLDGRGWEMPSPYDIRSCLTGSRIRTWWAAWVLAFEREEIDGLFNWDPRHILLDIFDFKPEYSLSKGKRYPRPNRAQERQIAKDFIFLESCILRGIGDGADSIEVENGEPLIHRYGSVKRNGRTMEGVNLCAHARLAVVGVKSNAIQLPRKAFHLHADDAPLAMGLANVLRKHALGRSAWLKRGILSMPLADLASEAGEDIAALQRKHHRQAWEYLRDKAERTIEPGGFGKVHFGRDAGESTIVTIEPSEPLVIAYRTMIDAQDRKRAYDEEAAVRAALENKRPRGRPRKMPQKKAGK
jgi:hypothetical protein